MTVDIVIIDYGAGNLRSVEKAFNKLGYNAVISADTDAINAASHIVLPGVGAFKDSIGLLRGKGLDAVIADNIAKGKPLLGICLGMQMLFERSFEDGEHRGLGILRGDVIKFDVDLKIPHIGWNEALSTYDSRLYRGVCDRNFYFVHSYYVPSECAYANVKTTYGIEFTSGVESGNVFGVQFHPEKSGDTGLKLLDNFANIK